MLEFAVKLKGSGEETGDILALRDAAYSEWGWNDGVQMPRLATEATRATLDGQVRRSTLVPTAPCTQQGTMLPSEPSFRPHTARNKGSCPAPFRIPHPAPFRIPSLPNPPPRSLQNPLPSESPAPLPSESPALLPSKSPRPARFPNWVVGWGRETGLLSTYGQPFAMARQAMWTGARPPADAPPRATGPPPAFDDRMGATWIYPINAAVREYQLQIVEKALFRNTLVCLPTGLGKTFIAAVVMYNFYRWFPTGKLVFMAPTKPLVAQQVDGCHRFTGISRSQVAELTGAVSTDRRPAIWRSKRVFFVTPQIIHRDLESGICPGESIVCIVVDEAHR